MFPQHIIAKKRDGQTLARDEIEAFVRGATDGSWADYQLSALLMAVYLRGMTPEETAMYTTAMMNSGVVADLSHDGQTATIAKGGKGGLGNIHFKSSTNRAPRQCTPGTMGESRNLQLELKVLADVGLLGMPNAGKSTFIRAVSAARPKVADYPFTTLHPNLGVVRVDEGRSFVVADIPGLIEGAAEGAGLGHQFLRHLQRTRVLLHLVDIVPLDESADPVHDAAAIIEELRKYDEALYHKQRWLILNKVDLAAAEDRDARVDAFLSGYRKSVGEPEKTFTISALTGEGTRALVFAIMEYLEANARVESAESEELTEHQEEE